MNIKENEYTGIWIRIGDMQIDMPTSGYPYMVDMEKFIKFVQEKAIKEYEKKQQDELKTAKAIAYDQGVAEGKRTRELGCEGCRHASMSRYNQPCRSCCNNYMCMWEPEKKDDEIEFGDEVIDEDGEKGIVVSKDNAVRKELWVLFNGYDVPQSVFKIKYKKTGKRYDLDAFMEGLKR